MQIESSCLFSVLHHQTLSYFFFNSKHVHAEQDRHAKENNTKYDNDTLPNMLLPLLPSHTTNKQDAQDLKVEQPHRRQLIYRLSSSKLKHIQLISTKQQ